MGQKGLTLWLTGLSGSGKSTIAVELEHALIDNGHVAYTLDGDNVPIFSSKSRLSTVNSCVTFTTLAFGKFASPILNNTLPGACARFRFEVSAHTTTVFMRLRLKRLKRAAWRLR